MNDLLMIEELPQGFGYPLDFIDVISTGVIDVGPWQFLKGKWLQVRNFGLKERFPDRQLVPFARRLDSDDVACWDMERPSAVCVVHDFCAPGWESRETYDSFEQWYLSAQKEENYEE
jgi:hypothetical protein